MAPSGQETYALSNADNYADVELSAEAAGIAIALLAYSAYPLPALRPATPFQASITGFGSLRATTQNLPRFSGSPTDRRPVRQSGSAGQLPKAGGGFYALSIL